MSFATVLRGPRILKGQEHINPFAWWAAIRVATNPHQDDGTWSEALPSAQCDMVGFHLVLFPFNNVSGDRRWWVDVGTGPAGQERMRVRGIGGNYAQYNSPPSGGIYIPLQIKRGERVVLRARQSGTSSTMDVHYSCHFIPQTGAIPTGFANCTTVGLDLSNTTGTYVQQGLWPGGPITELTSGIPHPVRAVSITTFGHHNNGYGSNTLLAGPSGAERRIVFKVAHGANSNFRSGVQYQGPFYTSLRPNTRLSLRRYYNSADYPMHFALHLWH